jgi:hypothetical protein
MTDQEAVLTRVDKLLEDIEAERAKAKAKEAAEARWRPRQLSLASVAFPS